MAKCLFMVMLVSIVILNMTRPMFSQEIDPYSEEVPEDVIISPTSDYDIDVETPEEDPFEADSPAMRYDTELMHHYSHKQLNFLDKCVQKTNSRCGDEIFKDMLNDEQMTNECCRYLLKIGKDCHLGMVQLIFSTYEYKNLASKAIPRSKQTWNSCVRRIGSQIAAPVSLEN